MNAQGCARRSPSIVAVNVRPLAGHKAEVWQDNESLSYVNDLKDWTKTLSSLFPLVFSLPSIAPSQ